ncbi:MAG: transcription termination factor NusA [Anaerolineae bacterium]|jgi:N utilization substance protein A
MKSEFERAITQLSADRNLAPEVILEAIEQSLVLAYKKHFGATQSVVVKIDSHTGAAQVYVAKQVVDQVLDPMVEIDLPAARALQPTAKLGDLVEVEEHPENFGRIAAQTAKQVITQRIKEAERDTVYAEFEGRVGEIINGVVRNVDARTHNVTISLGKAEAVLPRTEQIPGEHYRFGQRVRAYVDDVSRDARGPQITVSRTHPDLLKRLLELEVPEIANGIVEVKRIAREPGYRSKIAVVALQSGVDPVGSCVGMRGVRIQNIVNELGGEKIDVVEWSSDEREFISNALSPAKAVQVLLDNPERLAIVIVPDRALSLAIGKEGQNARLAAKLTGWRIDIKSETEAAEEAETLARQLAEAEERARQLEEQRRAAAELLSQAEALMDEEDAELEELEEGVAWAEDQYLASEPSEPGELPEEAPALEQAELSEGEAEGEPELAQPELAEAQEAPVAQAEPEAAQAPAEGDEEWYREAAADDASEDEEEDSDRDRGRKKGRRLEYDEKLGRVVARKQHKQRGRRDWSTDWED